MKQLGQVAPDPEVDFELFDRVVNVRTLGVAPYGLKGTVVGIHQGLLLIGIKHNECYDWIALHSKSVFPCGLARISLSDL